MGTRGRKPKPTALKLLAGDRADRINLREAAADGEAPAKPTDLGDQAGAKWDQLVDQLRAVGLLSSRDGDALGVFIAAYSRWLDARGEIKERGVLIETEIGFPPRKIVKKNPAVDVCNASELIMLRVLVEFGLTPSSRSRIPAAVKPAADSLDDFLSKAARG